MTSALLLLLLSCRAPAPGGAGDDTGRGSVILPVGAGELRVDPGGFLDLVDAQGAPVLQHAYALAMLDSAVDGQGRVLRTDGEGSRSLAVDGDTVTLRTQPAEGPALSWELSAQDGRLTARLTVHNDTGEEVAVAKLAALRTDGDEGGGLFLGTDPARHRILENGSHAALDFVAEVRAGDVEADEGAALLSPGEYDGHSVSNWNHAVVDLDGEAVWVAGALSFERSMPVLQLSADRLDPVMHGERSGFTFFSAEADYLPEPRPVAAGSALSSETWWLSPFEEDALLGLEAYADAVAAHLGLTPWHRRAEGRRVPNGWNSWSTSGSTGGYGTAIDEALILDNLDWMATELRDWGMDWFQVDDGYEPSYGDWQWREDTFPSGARGMSDAIRARGLKPGIWIAPFTADPDSALVAEHPDWFADKTVLGNVVASDTEILDLSHPEVQAWLFDLFTEVREEWGFDWVKLDFGYYALFAQEYRDGLTREEAWREGVGVVRQALGEEVFLLLIGIMGPNYGLADSMRTTLDNAPVWDWQPDLELDDVMEQQGFKPTVRTAGRRWYLHDRVWVNHPDLVVFRSNTVDEDWPRVSFEEARAFATFVGLSGGIVKLGDRLLELDGDAVNVIRTLLPTYGTAARPLDVFTREFPEVWHLPVHAPIDGYGESYEVLGLFNWGLNLDLSVQPFAELPDDGSSRAHSVDLAARGLDGEWLAYEFWTGSFLGPVEGTLELEVPAHDCRVVALRRPTGAPQFLGWNRQLTMGGSVLEAADWDAEAGTLTVRTPVVPGTALAPFSWRLAFFVPEGFAVEEVGASGAEIDGLTWSVEGQVLTVGFEAVEVGELALVLGF